MMKKYILLLVLLVQLAEIQAQTPEQRLEELGISLSEPGEPVGTYVNWRRVGNLVYIAGVGASVFGKVGKDLTIKEGYEAARLTGVQVISILKEAVGDLTKI